MHAQAVAEVIRAPRMTRVPHGAPALMGLMYARGAVMPVVSLERLLDGAAPSRPGRVIILRGNPGIGLAVDTVEALKTHAADEDGPGAGHLLLEDDDGRRWFDLDASLKSHFAASGRAGGRTGDTHTGVRETATAAPSYAFLGFQLAGQAYALPLDAILDVNELPAVLTALPHAEAPLLGLMEVRGHVTPVVSLRALLGLPARAARKRDRVIAVRIHGLRLGLLVDGIGAVLRAPPEAVSPAPTLFNQGAGEARITSVLRMPDGHGLVSILTPDGLFADARVAQVLADAGAQRHDEAAATPAAEACERFLVIRLGVETYGLPLAAVEEVVGAGGMLARLPHAPDYVRGLLNLRGRIIPVLDQSRRFSVPDADKTDSERPAGRIVILSIDGIQVGLAVGAAPRIIAIPSSDIRPAPELSGDGERLFDRAAPLEGGGGGDVILLIDPQALLARADADLMRDLAIKRRDALRAPDAHPPTP